MNLRRKDIALCSLLAACFYVAIMLTFDRGCFVAEKTLSQENSIISYVDAQFSSQELPQNTISNIVNLCKTPIKKQNNEDKFLQRYITQHQFTTFAYVERFVRNTLIRIFSNTDIIFPFNYFW